MVRIKKEMDYALRALATLAGSESVLSVGALVKRTGIPADFLRKIMQQMNHAGLVSSRQGPFGGYRLRGKPQEISFAEVMNALGGVAVSPCCTDDQDCTLTPTCLLRKQFQQLQKELDSWMESRKLTDIMEVGSNK